MGDYEFVCHRCRASFLSLKGRYWYHRWYCGNICAFQTWLSTTLSTYGNQMLLVWQHTTRSCLSLSIWEVFLLGIRKWTMARKVSTTSQVDNSETDNNRNSTLDRRRKWVSSHWPVVVMPFAGGAYLSQKQSSKALCTFALGLARVRMIPARKRRTNANILSVLSGRKVLGGHSRAPWVLRLYPPTSVRG